MSIRGLRAYVLGAVPLLVALTAAQVSAAPVVYELDTSTGGLFGAEQSCTQVILAFNSADCTYGAARLGETFGYWQGPASNGGFFARAGIGSDISYNPSDTAANKLNEITVHFLTGSTVTVEDNGTACDLDDRVSATWIFGPAARNVATGNGRNAVETWDSVTHTMAPTTVTKATPNGTGGCDYEISVEAAGVDGAPSFPPRICAATDPTDCYPTPNAPSGLGTGNFWVGAGSGSPPNRIRTTGIERSPGMGANTAAVTTGAIVNWTCVASLPASGDCAATVSSGPSPILWGVNPSGGPTPNGQARAPDFSNLVLKFSTDNSGAQTKVKNGFAYYTREFRIALGNTPPGDNSWQGGAFAFTSTGSAVTPAGAHNDIASTTVNSSVPIAITQNDVGFVDPVAVAMLSSPLHGALQISGSQGPQAGVLAIYTPNTGYVGPDLFRYTIFDGVNAGVATVNITVTPKAVDDYVTTNIAQPVTIHVLANDVGFDDRVAIDIVANAGHGALTVNNSPGSPASVSVTYTPIGHLLEPDSFVYSATSSSGTDNATVVIDLTGDDTDGDLVADQFDNCTLLGNPSQRDTDNDGYGNICDPDFNNDGVVNINDLNRLKARLSVFPVVDLDTDLDGNGTVNINDLNRLKSFLGQPLGPSGLHPNCPPTCP